jgi:hypothetical protein
VNTPVELENGGCKIGAFKKNQISIGNHFEEEDFYPDNF